MGRIIVIGDSHLIPLKRCLESTLPECQEQITYLPHRFIKKAHPNDFVSQTHIFYRPKLDSKVEKFYKSGNISVSSNSEDLCSIPVEGATIFLVGLGLGVDGLIRGFSRNGALNSKNVVNFPILSSCLDAKLSSLSDLFAYPENFLRELFSVSIQKSFATKMYKLLSNSGMSSVHLIPMPLLSLDTLRYYSLGSYESVSAESFAETIRIWLEIVSARPGVCDLLNIVPANCVSDGVFLGGSETYIDDPKDVHMSINACLGAAEFISSFL